MAAAGGCSRAALRYGQSAGQAISVNRFVPQQTAQICLPSAGHARRAFRWLQSGQITKSPDYQITKLPNLMVVGSAAS
jgi:hypothetical protein